MKDFETTKQLKPYPHVIRLLGFAVESGMLSTILGCMGLIELCDIKRMRLILFQMVCYFLFVMFF